MTNTVSGSTHGAATTRPTRATAAVLAGAATVATVVGSVLPLDTSGDGQRWTNAWTGGAATGIAFTIAAAVLAAATVQLVRRARRPALAAVSAGAGLLAGLVVTVRLASAAAAHNAQQLRATFPDLRIVDTAGIGAWVLGGAAVLALGAAALAVRAFGRPDGPPGGSRPLAALAGVLAAGLAVAASLLAITVTTVAGPPHSIGYATGWGFVVASGPAGAGQAVPLVGVPLVIAAAVLLLGSLLVLDMHGAERAAPLLTLGAAGLAGVLGATWTGWLALVEAQSTADIGIATTLGAGTWVLLAATLVGLLLGAVLWLRPTRRPLRRDP
ncbi:hypothetical protein SAMN05443637_11448 [Pseudonocardia thermophila]|uniref:Uncharacterized protein n=1 Tax=Pseudonocardia thermophila TaxID=1848 RepID=A0A1M6W9T4_PSETH|nr:hypothetical protein [Pseudonocardia thermophila]SHK90523.1 hypothetical protein SAMN05443637_11448 [Pseudonocardia thermophila]